MYETINEPVQVTASFSGKSIKPLWFQWNKNTHRVQSVTFQWKDRVGASVLHCFSVSDGATLYELVFDSNNINWTLRRVYIDG